MKPKAPKKRDPKPSAKSGEVVETSKSVVLWFDYRESQKTNSFMNEMIEKMTLKLIEDFNKQKELEDKMIQEWILMDRNDPIYFSGIFPTIKD